MSFQCGVYRAYRYYQTCILPTSKHVIALTGCDTGLGYNLAIHCRDKGAQVIAGVLQNDGKGAVDLRNRGIKVVPLDVTNNQSISSFGDEIEKILGNKELEFHALVNNAGIMIFGEFEWLLADQTRSQIQVNLLGTMSITRRLIPTIRKHKSRIINVTSHCAIAPLPGLSVYGATKAALQGWSTSLRVEFGKYGVKVVQFIPGSFTQQSNIMSQQKKYFDDMRSAMSDEMRQFYGDYFEKYAAYLSTMSTDNSLVRIENPKLYKTFDGALLDVNPSAVYKCEPWRYKIYHTLFSIAPTYIRDSLVERFMQMPIWKPNDKINS